MRKGDYKLVLAIHPSTYGFGWVVMDGPLSLVDWGLVTATRDKNATCLTKVERLLSIFRPEVLVLEEFESDTSLRHARIRKLATAIAALGAKRGAEVMTIMREEVADRLEISTQPTRYEIAKVVATHVPELRHRLPPFRKPWMSEDPRMALFAAAALAVTGIASS